MCPGPGIRSHFRNNTETELPDCHSMLRTAGWFSRYSHFNELQAWYIPIVFGIRCKKRELMLNGLGGKPEILHTKIMTAAVFRELRCENAKDICGFASDAEHRLAAHSPQGSHSLLLLSGVSHQFD